MNKEEFLQILKNRLSFLNEKEMNVHIDYYDEAISDRIEEGMNEFDAVKELGAIADLVKLIKAEYIDDTKANDKVELSIKETKEDIKLEQESKEEVEQNNKKNNLVFWIVVILTSPLSFVVIMTIFCLLLSLALTAISLLISGVVMLFATVTLFSSPFTTILFNLGISLIAISIGIILSLATKFSFKYTIIGSKRLIKFIKEEL